MNQALHLPPVERSRIRQWLRRLRAWSEAIERWLRPHRLWLRMVFLVMGTGFLVITISLFGWTLNLATMLSLIVFLAASLTLASAVLRVLDDWSRNHVGGMRLKVTSTSLNLPDSFRVLTVAKDSPDLKVATEFADRLYLGTMVAGAGIMAERRIQERMKQWSDRISAVPNALCIAVDASNELAALSLVYPLDAYTLRLEREGRLDYRNITPKQMEVAPATTREYGIYIAVSIGDGMHIRKLEESGVDLVGSLLTRHIAMVMHAQRLPSERAVLVTDGFRGKALTSYLRKGFTKLPQKNPYGYPVLELAMERLQGETFVIAIKAQRARLAKS